MSKKTFAMAAGVPFLNKFSATFDGVDEFINLGDVADFERTDSWSIAAWFKTTASGGSLISRRGPSTTFKGWEINNSSGSIRFNLTSNNAVGNRLQVKTTSAAFNDGAWQHVVATYNGNSLASGMKIYINGSSEALTTDFDNLTANISNTSNANLGARNSGDNPWNGNIDEAAIYDKELSAVEVSQIYNAGVVPDLKALPTSANVYGWWSFTQTDINNFPTIADLSGNGRNGTATNMAVGNIVSDTP